MTWTVACFCGRVFTAPATTCPGCGRALPETVDPARASRRREPDEERRAGAQHRLPAYDLHVDP